MIPTNQFKNGMTVIIDGQIYLIVSFQHVKPGKGGAFVRTKLKNLQSGNLIDKTFRSGEKIEQAFMEEKKMQFLYRQSQVFHFMNQTTFEEFELTQEQLGDRIDFLKEGMILSVLVCQGKIMDINLPNFVELEIKQTEPGLRTDTVKAALKQAIVETGGKVLVPLFIEKGDIVKIDTRNREYISRA